MPLRAFLFDLDGTLADTFPAGFAAFHEALAAHTDRTYSDQELMTHFGPSESGIFQALVPDRWEACLDRFLETYERVHSTHAHLFPGIPAVLARLRALGLRLGLVTGKGAESAAISLRHLGIASCFEAVETGSPLGIVKPACMGRILAAWGIPPAEAAYLGDTASDIEAAKAAGLVPLAAAWETHADRAALLRAAPAALFERVQDFTDWVQRTLEA
jgi:pyrophosphatase PpaX